VSFTDPISRYIHPFRYIYPGPLFFFSQDCDPGRRYLKLLELWSQDCVPGRRYPKLLELWSQDCVPFRRHLKLVRSRKGHKREFDVSTEASDRPICGVSIHVPTSQRDPILLAVHTYMNTHLHTHHTCLYICELVRCSGIWRGKQKTEGEQDRDKEWRWLINN